ILTHGRNVRTGDVSFDSHQHIEITEGDVLQGTATFPVRYYHRRPDNFSRTEAVILFLRRSHRGGFVPIRSFASFLPLSRYPPALLIQNVNNRPGSTPWFRLLPVLLQRETDPGYANFLALLLADAPLGVRLDAWLRVRRLPKERFRQGAVPYTLVGLTAAGDQALREYPIAFPDLEEIGRGRGNYHYAAVAAKIDAWFTRACGHKAPPHDYNLLLDFALAQSGDLKAGLLIALEQRVDRSRIWEIVRLFGQSPDTDVRYACYRILNHILNRGMGTVPLVEFAREEALFRSRIKQELQRQIAPPAATDK
ncbi:MAG: hypothetical protein AAGK14_08235, partial [Verrucomicrobiota bacterium]